MPNLDWGDPKVREAAKDLIRLIINQDHVAAKWFQFLITIEAGFAVAFGFLFKTDVSRPTDPGLFHTAEWLIPVIAAVTAIALSPIIIHERKWQAYFVRRFNSTGPPVEIFPTEHDSEGLPQEQPLGYVSRSVVLATAVIVGAWVVVLCRLIR